MMHEGNFLSIQNKSPDTTTPGVEDTVGRLEGDQPLPVEVTLNAASWFSRSRNYPIFSGKWLRYRSEPFLLVGIIMGLMVLFESAIATTDLRVGIVNAAMLTIPIVCFSCCGPVLAVWVHARKWRVRREAISLLCALVLGGVLAAGISQGSDAALRKFWFGSADAKMPVYVEAGVFVRPLNDKVDPSGKSNEPILQQAQKNLSPYAVTAVVWFDKILVVVLSLILYGWIGGGLDLLTYFRQRRRLADVVAQQALQKALVERNEAELKLSVLAAQVEPHFLFNTLAGVRGAIASDPSRAMAIIDHLTDYLRLTIPRLRSEGAKTTVALETQIETARAYLSLMQARIPRLSFSFHVAPELHHAQMPPLMLISLVENAVKHGIEPKIGEGHIVIRAELCAVDTPSSKPLQFELSVTDNGVGFGHASSGTGIGLANIRERLQTQYGEKAALGLKAVADGGVRATIRLPLQFD